MGKKQSILESVDKGGFESLLESEGNLSGVLKSLGLSLGTSRYLALKLRLHDLKVDYARFCGKVINKGGGRKERSLEEVLVEHSDYARYNLKKRLVKEGLLQYECGECKMHEWRGRPLSLQLDHVNGVPDDNRLENLRLLCPNCHSQTDNFSGRAVKRVKRPSKILKGRGCPRLNRRKVDRPSFEVLKAMLWERPTQAIAKEYGVSDKAIEKWARSYCLEKPPRGYWQKVASRGQGSTP
jgi:hypothetical protein